MKTNKNHLAETGLHELAEPSECSSIERNCHYLLLIDEASQGLDDVAAGRERIHGKLSSTSSTAARHKGTSKNSKF